MNQGVDYRRKYLELRNKFMGAIDTAFRMGYEQGSQDTQAEMAMQAMARPQIDPMTGQPAPQPAPDEAGSDASSAELDQHIAALEQAVSKAERSPDLAKAEGLDIGSIRRALGGLKAYRERDQLAKSMKKIKALSATIKSRQLGLSAQRNLDHHAQATVTKQQQIVDNIMKKWEEEERQAAKDVVQTLSVEGLLDKLPVKK